MTYSSVDEFRGLSDHELFDELGIAGQDDRCRHIKHSTSSVVFDQILCVELVEAFREEAQHVSGNWQRSWSRDAELLEVAPHAKPIEET